MNKENIISEGILSYLFNLIKHGHKFEKWRGGPLTKLDKQLLKDKQFIKSLKRYEKIHKDAEKKRIELNKKYQHLRKQKGIK